MIPKISVIIPAYNAAATLPDCLTALRGQVNVPALFEILVVDDGSSDCTAEVAQRFPVTLLQQPHAGPAAARNLGLQAAQGELIFFTDADCVPANDWLATMAHPFTEEKVAGCKGIYATRQTELVARFVQLEYDVKYGAMATCNTIDFIDTYSAGYRRSTLLAAGGFDPRFPGASVEDAELAFRLSALGYQLVFNPAARVWHRHPHTLVGYLHRKARYGFWRVRVYTRYPAKLQGDSHTPRALWWQLPLACTLILTVGFSLLWSGAAWASIGLALLFLLTCLPFIQRAVCQGELRLAWVTPVLLGLRALALTGGLLVGVIQLSLVPGASEILSSRLTDDGKQTV
jgi:glycosyltransferase involved in cell wall biosynthesis